MIKTHDTSSQSARSTLGNRRGGADASLGHRWRDQRGPDTRLYRNWDRRRRAPLLDSSPRLTELLLSSFSLQANISL
jgi:hypothetical protein